MGKKRGRRELWSVVGGRSPIFVALLLGCSTSVEPEDQRRELAAYFEGFASCFVLLDLNRDRFFRYNPSRCGIRQPPCSTFKIPHSLIALQTGVLSDEDSQLAWDGTKQLIPAWESDQTLASAVRVSCVWYFQRVARKIGEERMQQYLAAIDYGNQDIAGGLDRFWLTSSLLISANEQVAFLSKLYRNQLPFDGSVMETVRKILVVEEKNGSVLSGKTGSGIFDDGRRIGWFVGHVKSDAGEFVFATTIHGDQKNAWGPKAREISEAVLGRLGLWESAFVKAS